MTFNQTPIVDVYLVDPERQQDARGFFCRTWCEQEFKARGLMSKLVQCSISFNAKRGTLRGLHFQRTPHQETKLVRCTLGAIFDVVIDLRPESESYLKWFGTELNAENRHMLYIPARVAHGFQTLVDDAEIFYQMGARYAPQFAGGVRWNDPAFRIEWPAAVTEISQRDQSFADYSPKLIL